MSVIIARPSGSNAASSGPGGSNLELVKEFTITPSPPSALGQNSVAIGENAQTDISAPNSLAIGNQSLTRHRGAVVQANGRFGSSGDAQKGQYLLRTGTINNVETELFLDGTNGTERLILPDNCTWLFTATIVGHRTDSNNGHAGYKVEGIIYRISGANTTSLLGTPVKSIIAETDSTWDINIYADTTNGSLKITATGQTSKTIRWLAVLDTVELTN